MDAPPRSKESQKNHPAFPCNWSDQISQQFNLCSKFYEELFSATSNKFQQPIWISSWPGDFVWTSHLNFHSCVWISLLVSYQHLVKTSKHQPSAKAGKLNIWSLQRGQTGTASPSPFAISTTEAFSPWMLDPLWLLLLFLKEDTRRY